MSIPGKIALDENTWAVPCLDEQEECYLAILKGGEDGSDFGVLIRLEELYQAVAGNLIAGTQDQIFLMDTRGQVFIRQEGEEIRAGILPEQETGSRRAEDMLIAEAHRISREIRGAVEARVPEVKHCLVHVNPAKSCG